MSDIRKYITLLETAQQQELNEMPNNGFAGRQPDPFKHTERKMGTDLAGNRMWASITMNRRAPSYSYANIMVDAGRFNDCLAIVEPATSNPTADSKLAWIVKQSYSEKYHHLTTGEHSDLLTALKSVKNEYLTLQREEMDERNYGRPGHGNAKFSQYDD